MPNKFSQGAKRWFVGGVAVPLSAKALDHLATRLERAEGKTVLSLGLRASAKVVGKRGSRRSGSTAGAAADRSTSAPGSRAPR